jgi:hypothetical protein
VSPVVSGRADATCAGQERLQADAQQPVAAGHRISLNRSSRWGFGSVAAATRAQGTLGLAASSGRSTGCDPEQALPPRSPSGLSAV